jgi:hypothetical protein
MGGADHLRRILLWERDVPGAVNIGLIDHAARFALDHGYDVILEGIVDAGRYGEMLPGLTDDHLGTTRHYYFDIQFDETVERHAAWMWDHGVTAEHLRSWYRAHDLLTTVEQQVSDQTSSLDETVERVLSDLDWQPKVLAAPPGER